MSNLATIVNNILADSGIDDINVVVTTGSYTNPSWIVSLPWTKITGTPTTLGGYGITDAYTQTQVNNLLNAKLSLSGGTMTGPITLPNGVVGIVVGDDATIADRNVANTMYVAGVQNTDRGYINFSETGGNQLGAVNGGDLTWRGVPIITTSNISGDTNYVAKFTSGNSIGNSQIFDNGTNTGVGTATPTQKFEVSGGAIIASGFGNRAAGTGKALEIGMDGTNAVLQALDRTASAFIPIAINSSGAVFNNTVTATQYTAQANNSYYRVRRAAGTDVGYVTDSGTWGDSGTDFAIGASSTNLRFYTNNSVTERMRLDDAGRFGIGVTPTQRLDVNGNGKFRGNDLFLGSSVGLDNVIYIYSQNGGESQIRTNAGVSASYNGMMIASNYNQANSLPSWSLDLGGALNSTANPNTFTVGYKPFGGAWVSLMIVNANGDTVVSNNFTSASAVFNNGTNSTNGIKVVSSTSASVFTGGIEFIRTTVAGGSKVQPLRDAAIGGVGFDFLVTANNAAEISASYTSAVQILNTGAAIFNGSVTGNSALFNGNLQTNGVLTIGNQNVAGNYFLQITPSTTNRVSMQAALAGVGISDIVMQPSGGSVGIGTSTSITGKFTVQGTQAEIHVKNDDTRTLTLGGWDGTRQYIKSINLGVALTPLTLQASSFNFDTGNVGIGTPSTIYKLQVGDLANTSGVKNDVFITGDTVNTNGFYARLIFGNSSQSGGSTASIRAERIGTNFATSLTFYTNEAGSAGNGSERLRISSTGQATFSLGIEAKKALFGISGVATPSLIVNDNDQSNVRLRLQNSTSGNTWDLVGGLNAANNSDFSIYDVTNNVTALRIVPATGAATFSSTVTYSVGFSSYTVDGLFSANARYGAIFTPSGNDRIRFGYFDQGGGQYWGRIGFQGNTNWSLGTGAGGHSFVIGINNGGGGSLVIDNAGSLTVANNINNGGSIAAGTVLSWNGGIGALSFNTGVVTMETNSATRIELKTNGTTALTLQTNQTARFANLLGIGRDPSHALDASGSIRGSDRLYWNGQSQLVYILNYDQIPNADTTTVADSTATNGFALRKSGGSSTFFFGNYTSFPPGNYTAYFRLKVASNASSGTLGTLDVVGGTIIPFAITLRPNMFQASDTWQYIKLPFTITGTGYIEWRLVSWTGLTETFFDHIMVYQEGGEGNVFTRNAYSVYVNQNTLGMQLNTSGALTVTSSVTATSFFESSDFRLKSEIQDLDIDVINIAAKSYLKNGIREIGYIAQDVESILPSAISKRDDGYLDLSYRQVHTAKIAALEKEVLELKQKLKNK